MSTSSGEMRDTGSPTAEQTRLPDSPATSVATETDMDLEEDEVYRPESDSDFADLEPNWPNDSYELIHKSMAQIARFRKAQEHKVPMTIKIRPLRAIPFDPKNKGKNFRPWWIAIKLLARLHGVYTAIFGYLIPLPHSRNFCSHVRADFPDIAGWRLDRERMVDLAMGIIYANVADDVRANGKFQTALLFREPSEMMRVCREEFGNWNEALPQGERDMWSEDDYF